MRAGHQSSGRISRTSVGSAIFGTLSTSDDVTTADKCLKKRKLSLCSLWLCMTHGMIRAVMLAHLV
jgi:hypothetical protein